MNWRPKLVFLVAMLACAGEREQETDPTDENPHGWARLTVDELPPRPDYPSPRNGRLVAVSAGDHVIEGTWDATAGLCEEAGVLEIYAGPQGLGTAIVVRMQAGDRLGVYSIVEVSEIPPEPPVVLLGVQIFDDPSALGFQAFAGELELTELGRHTSGRFTSTLREVREDVYTHFVGAFERIPVEIFSDDYCEILRGATFEAGDSLNHPGHVAR